MQLQYTLMGDVDTMFGSVEEEAKYCMNVALMEYIFDKYYIEKPLDQMEKALKKAWAKFNNSEKTELKNRAVGCWVEIQVNGKLTFNKVDDRLRDNFKGLNRSIFSSDRKWREIYNFMDEK